MKIIECEQGSAEWIAARIGIPTASNFARLLTPTGRISAQAETYMCELLAEWMLDSALDNYVTEWMERGRELEEQAFAYYELQHGVDVSKVGFCLDDSGAFGCSPDGLIYLPHDGPLVGGMEIKCPGAAVHVSHMLDMPKKYGPQCQGGMLVTGAKWWDLMSYHPELPPALVRIERDEEYIGNLRRVLDTFCARLDEAQRLMVSRGYTERSPMFEGVGA